MDASRRRSLLLSILSALVALLLVDWPFRHFEAVRGYGPDGLAHVPAYKLLFLVGILTAVCYATARIVHTLGRSPRQRTIARLLTALVLGGLGWGAWSELHNRAGEHWSRDVHLPLMLPSEGLTGTAWWNVTGGDCGFVNKEVIVFESEARAVRYRSGGFGGDELFPLLVALDVWPHGQWVASGTVEDGVVTWEEDGHVTKERIVRTRRGLRLEWIGGYWDESVDAP